MRKLPRVILALAFLLLGCPKRVTVGGQEPPPTAASADAEREVQRARAETTTQPWATAAERFEAIAGRYPDAPAAADALHEAGVRWRAARRPDRAREAFSRLVSRFPLYRRAPEAKYQLAQLDLEAGRAREALAALTPLYDTLPPALRPDASRDAARAAEGAGAWTDAVRWRLEAARQSQGDGRAREVARAVEHVDAHLSTGELERLKSELPGDSPLLPAVTVKLARIRLHLRDDAAAERLAREAVDRWPDSPFAGDARQILDRFSPRGPVNARVIGVAVPLSGRQKAWGEAILQGVNLALGDGGPYTVVAKDTRGEPDGAQAAVEELAATAGAIAIVGGVVNAEAPRAAAAAQERGVPLVSLSRVDDVTAAGPFVFRNMLTAQAQAKALAELAMGRRGMRRFGLLYPQVAYGQELAGAFWDEVDARGGEVRAAETYDFDRTTFAPLVKSMVGKLWLDERQDYLDQLREIATQEQDPFRRRKAVERLRARLPPVTDFDAIFIPDFARNVALVAPALAVEDVITQTCDPREVERIRKATGREDLQPVQLLGANGWDDPTLVEKAGKYVECAIFVDGFFPASERPETKAFVTEFQARFGHLPSILEASAYDATRMVRRVLEGGAGSREAVRDGLAGLKAFPGATGELAFDARREVAKRLFYLTVANGTIRELTPQELAAGVAGGT